jgi:hypothetical protein
MAGRERSVSSPLRIARSSPNGTSGRFSLAEGGGSVTIRAIVAEASPRSNGARPVRRKKSVAAVE